MLTRSDVFRIVETSKKPFNGDVSLAELDRIYDLIRLIALKIETEYAGLPGQPETMTVMDWLMPSYPLLDADSLTVEEGGNVVATPEAGLSVDAFCDDCKGWQCTCKTDGRVTLDARKPMPETGSSKIVGGTYYWKP